MLKIFFFALAEISPMCACGATLIRFHRPRSRCCQQECQLEFVTSPVMTKRLMLPLIQMLLDGIGRKGIW